MTSVHYPGAIWEPLENHSEPGRLQDKNQIILHITQGPSAQSAINTFKNSVSPHRTSAHFVIDRDDKATVYQLVDIGDVAWHASQANMHSVGIEHAAIAGKMAATNAQYKASAKLCRWLCNQMKIPIDRNHIRTHNEASPRDGHVLCCTGALDPDKVVEMAKLL